MSRRKEKEPQGQSSEGVREARDPRFDDVMDTLWEIGHIMGMQAQEKAAAYAQAAEAAPIAGNKVEEFIKLKPPKFHGRGDPETASRWVEELEKTFKVLGCTDEEKVTLAIYQLQDSANDWWNATEGRVFPEGTASTWAVFVENFYEKYFSENAQEKKLMEFMRLRQGQMTVDQYEAEFARLAKFGPTMVENPRDRA
ncbi:uncharacterized protein LOC130139445 [Syzygium oleosum]|uniref:uncharacterized protein LOC130139445 n=1 Tax=Syzygium oleosum TaxID=219896 RepID=UPI0024BA2003|nr:uncharacterized protein LOC130139445 [Syzygium oleosum]